MSIRFELREFLGSCPCAEHEVDLLSPVGCWLHWLQVCWSNSGPDFHLAGVSSKTSGSPRDLRANRQHSSLTFWMYFRSKAGESCAQWNFTFHRSTPVRYPNSRACPGHHLLSELLSSLWRQSSSQHPRDLSRGGDRVSSRCYLRLSSVGSRLWPSAVWGL